MSVITTKQRLRRPRRPTFVKVMKAVPPDKAGYKPHERSTSAGDLVWLLATELA